MQHFRTVALALLLIASPLFGGKPKECLDLTAARDSNETSPSGVQVVVTGRNHCSEDLEGSACRFKVTALSGDVALATQSGTFGGTIAAGGQAETKVFVVCNPDRVRSLKVEGE